jgi:hypothetical protein
MQELYAPLVTAIATDGVGMMGTVLLCFHSSPQRLPKTHPTLMAAPVFPSIRTFVGRCVAHRQTGSSPGICATELNHLPAEGRRQVVRMLRLLDAIRTGDGDSMAGKCSNILVKSLIDDLLSSRLISRRAVLMSSQQLVSSGCTIHSVVAATDLVAKSFVSDTCHSPVALETF